MENLSIKNNSAIITDNLVRIGDLVYFEGPLLTLFEDINSGRLYLYDWVDRNNTHNRWLIYRVSPASVLAFIQKKENHVELYKSNPDNKFYVADITTKDNNFDYTFLELNDVPTKYLPNIENYFDETDCPSIVKIKNTIIRLLSNKKQTNEYSPTTYPIPTSNRATKINIFNKINPVQYFRSTHIISILAKRIPATTIYNKYDKTVFVNPNSNLNLFVKKTNKMYA